MVIWPVLKSCRFKYGLAFLQCIYITLKLNMDMHLEKSAVRDPHVHPMSDHLNEKFTRVKQCGSRKRACMRVAAEEVEAMTRPQTERPAMTPPLADPAQAANAKMATCTDTPSCHQRVTKFLLLLTMSWGQKYCIFR